LKTDVDALSPGNPSIERLLSGWMRGSSPRMTSYREHSIATKLSQFPEQALLAAGTAPVISPRSILRNEVATANARD
jgi:hypothetical protein